MLYEGSEFEIRILKQYWLKYFENPLKFERAYHTLINGLDRENKEKIDRIIKLFRCFLVDKKTNLDIFSSSEIKVIEDAEKKMKKKEIITTELGQTLFRWDDYILTRNHFEDSVFFHRMGVPYLKNTNCLKNKDIIDAGAYIGDSAIILSEYTDKKIYAFEALKDNYNEIEINAHINHRENIIPINKALGDGEGIISFFIREGVDSGHGMIKRNELTYQSEMKVEQISLDDYVRQNEIKVGLIKVDIEGAEQKMIQGARKTIIKQKPAMIISIYHTADDFFMIKPLIESICPGYSFKIFQPLTRHSFCLETCLICEYL